MRLVDGGQGRRMRLSREGGRGQVLLPDTTPTAVGGSQDALLALFLASPTRRRAARGLASEWSVDMA